MTKRIIDRQRRMAVAIILLMCTSVGLKCQVSRTSYFLNELPESGLLNPASAPSSRFYVNLPFISAFHMGFESPFAFDELTAEWPGGDSLYLDRETIMGTLSRKNYFALSVYDQLAAAGAAFGKHSINLTVAQVFSTHFIFSEDLARLILYGNGDPVLIGNNVTIDKSHLSMNSYHEFGLGYAFRWNDRLTIGTRIKYLNGDFNVWMEKGNIDLFTSDTPDYPITMASDIRLHTSSTISDFDDLIAQVEKYQWFDLTRNHGWAADLGASFRLNDHWSFSASAADIGRIRWKDDVRRFISRNPGLACSFGGFELDDFFADGSFRDTLGILDTLQHRFGLEEYNDPYRAWITPKTYIGALYHFIPADGLGIMVRSAFTGGIIRPSATLSYYRILWQKLTLGASYSLVNDDFLNIGLVTSLRIGPAQIYVMTDFAKGWISGRASPNYSSHFGISFHIGANKPSEGERSFGEDEENAGP